MAAFPLPPRVLAGGGALLAGLTFGSSTPASLLERGFPLTAAAMLATTVPLVAALTAAALFPEGAQRLLGRFTRIDLRNTSHVSAAMILVGTLYFVLGYGSLVAGAFAYESEIVRGDEPAPIQGEALFVGLAINTVVFVLPPLLYVATVGDAARRGALDALGLHARGAGRALVLGAGSALGVLILIAVASVAVQGLEVEIPENERALEIARSVTVLGAFGLAIASSVGEEVFFRGFLQPRVGLLGQAVLFALAHLTYLNVLQIVVTFVLALIFGVVYRATGSLLAPIAGHFTFNLLMLLAGIYAPEAA